jgi:DNA-binding NarL/FixJ family response regulator
MSNPISGINASAQHAAAQVTVQPHETQAPQKTATVQHKADTVALSQTAQVRSLKRNGQSVAQIALSMGLDAKTVNSYLGTAQAPQVKKA